MPYQPATLKLRPHQDIERVGTDIRFAQGKDLFGTNIKWHFSFLGFFQWVSTIGMLYMMWVVQDQVGEMHDSQHGTDKEATPFAALAANVEKSMANVNKSMANVEKIYQTSLTPADTDGAGGVVNLPNVLVHINKMLHDNDKSLTSLTSLTSHMNDDERALKVDLSAFVEHHAEDVECTDCRDNLATALNAYADDDLHDCGFHYCLASPTPRFTSASGCADPAATNPSVHQDATCYNENTTELCTGVAAGLFTPLDISYTGAAADCSSGCVFTAGTACSDHTPTVAADGTGTCAAAFDSAAPTSAQECTVTGYKLYDAAECTATSLYPTSNATAAAETPCHPKCDARDFANSTDCFNSIPGTTGDVQFEDFLEGACISATGADSGTFSLFKEDHYRSHSLCAAADLAEPTAGTATAGALIAVQAGRGGARAACELLDFCRA